MHQLNAGFTTVNMFNMSDSVKFIFFLVLCLVICDNSLGALRKCAEYNEYVSGNQIHIILALNII